METVRPVGLISQTSGTPARSYAASLIVRSYLAVEGERTSATQSGAPHIPRSSILCRSRAMKTSVYYRIDLVVGGSGLRQADVERCDVATMPFAQAGVSYLKGELQDEFLV